MEEVLACLTRIGYVQEDLDTIHKRFQNDFKALSDGVKAIENPATYPVEIAPGLEKLQKNVIHAVIEKELGES